MMFTQREHINILYYDQFIMIFIKNSIIKNIYDNNAKAQVKKLISQL